MKISIETADNGYIVKKDTFAKAEVYTKTEEVFERLLQLFEGRYKSMGGGGYGEVIIKRERED